jgi:hypothetical protein
MGGTNLQKWHARAQSGLTRPRVRFHGFTASMPVAKFAGRKAPLSFAPFDTFTDAERSYGVITTLGLTCACCVATANATLEGFRDRFKPGLESFPPGLYCGIMSS